MTCVDYHLFTLGEVNLRSSVSITPSGSRVAIGHLGFTTPVPGVRLQHLACDLRLTASGAEVRNLELRTDSSTVRCEASVKGVNLLGGRGCRSCRARIFISASVWMTSASGISPSSSRRWSSFMDVFDLDLEAFGNLTELSVKRLGILLGGSRLSLSGSLLNLHRSDDLLLQVHIDGSGVRMDDVRALLPEFNLPTLQGLGPAVFSLDFDGKPLDFRTSLAAATQAGVAEANVALRIGGPATLGYRAEASVRGADIGAILGQPELRSSLNGRALIEGEGVGMDRISSLLDLTLDTSSFRGQTVAPSRL